MNSRAKAGKGIFRSNMSIPADNHDAFECKAFARVMRLGHPASATLGGTGMTWAMLAVSIG